MQKTETKERPLSNKQYLFVQGIIAGLTGTQAARKAGYKGGEKQLSVRAAENVGNSRIIAAIAQKRQEIKKELKIDDALLAKRFNRIALKTEKREDYDAALRANEDLGKHIGFFEADNKQRATSIVDFFALQLNQGSQQPQVGTDDDTLPNLPVGQGDGG